MRFLLFTLCLAGSAHAQTAISPDAFLDVAEGHTLTFNEFPSGGVVGQEEFLSRQRSIWRFDGQDCEFGEITIQGQLLCFLYESSLSGGPICWTPFQYGDQLLLGSITDGDLEFQQVTDISASKLDCANVPIS